MTREEYEKKTAETLDRRIAWWQDAAFGLFIHYGIYSVYGRGEWIKLREGISDEEYMDTLNNGFNYKQESAEEWALCAKNAGMKYVVLTTQHHDGFSLWDSKVNPYNSVNYGPKRDIVRDYVEACRKHGLKVGLYYSLNNWIHPDGQLSVFEEDSRLRFTADIKERLRELMTNYGKIDILWYDAPGPLTSAEAWDSVNMNSLVRELQPDILINNRCHLNEDFRVKEDNLIFPDEPGPWEGCMRFSTTAFGGVNHERALPHKINAHDIVKLMSRCQFGGGNFLFNISPNSDGSIDKYEKETLETVGRWVNRHAEAVYGAKERGGSGANGICTSALKGNKVYLWNWIWGGNFMRINGYKNAPKSVRCITNGEKVDFRYENGVIYFENLPDESPDDILDFAVFEMDFGDEKPIYKLIPQNLQQFMNI